MSWYKPGDRVQVASDGVIIATLTIHDVDEEKKVLWFEKPVPKEVVPGCVLRLEREDGREF